MIYMNLKDDQSEKVNYDYTDYPIYIRKGLLSSYPNYTAPMHWHDDIEFISVLEGEMQYNVNGEIITIRKNEGIIINARQMHFGYSDDKQECKFYCILLHPLLLCTNSAYEKDFVIPIIKNRNADYILLSQDKIWNKKILNLIEEIYSVKDKRTAPLLVQGIFSHLWSLLYENIQLNQEKKTKSSDLTIIKNMVGFIQKNYTDRISLKDIASSGSIGESKCCKLFKKYINETPNTYLNQYRLNKSTELLKNTDMSITEIALSVGYTGSSYYTETFRKWFGITPTEFKNK